MNGKAQRLVHRLRPTPHWNQNHRRCVLAEVQAVVAAHDAFHKFVVVVNEPKGE